MTDVIVRLTAEDISECERMAAHVYERRQQAQMVRGDLPVEEWLRIRKDAARNIDPETAEVAWCYAEVLDPYGVYDLSPEESCIGRSYFARSPAGNVWVSFYDLPDKIRAAFWKKLR